MNNWGTAGKTRSIAQEILIALFLALFFLLITTNRAISAEDSGVQIGQFTAQYYAEEDGKRPGKGNDGSLKEIATRLVYTEFVKRPAINFSYKFHDIDAFSFLGKWSGVIKVVDDRTFMTARFDVSRADVSLYVNNRLIDKWNDDNAEKILQFPVHKGDNEVRVEMHNHYHCARLNVSFADYPKLDQAGRAKLLQQIDFAATNVVYVGTYGSRSGSYDDNYYNELPVTLAHSTNPVFLFLSSFNAVNWVILNPHKVPIVGVAFQGVSPGSTVSIFPKAPVYEMPVGRESYKSSFYLKSLIGRQADYTFINNSVSSVTVPDLARIAEQPAVEAQKEERKTAEGQEKVRASEPAKYPVDAFKEKVVAQQGNRRISQLKIVKAPYFEGNLMSGTWRGAVEVSEKTEKEFDILYNGLRVELIIDGRSVWRGKDHGEKAYRHTFREGRHSVEFLASPLVDGQAGKLDVAINDFAATIKESVLAARLKELGAFDSLYCSVGASKTDDPVIPVRLKDSGRPVVLFLAVGGNSFLRSAVCDFQNSNTDNLAAVVTNSRYATTVKNLPQEIPVFCLSSLALTTKIIPDTGLRDVRSSFKTAALQILALTGKVPVGFSAAGASDSLEIPAISLDSGAYRKIGLNDISPDYNYFIEHPKKLDMVFTPVVTKYIDPSRNSGRIRAKKIEPEVQRPSWAEPLGVQEKDIPTGAFKAFYFDIYHPTKPEFTGIVKNISVQSGRPTSNKSHTALLDSYGIIPENFGAFWIGNIALQKDTTLDVNYNLSWAEARILIDNKVIQKARVTLAKGLHKVEVEFANNYHVYGFTFSLTEARPLLSYEELKVELAKVFPKLPWSLHTAYVGVRKSGNLDNSVTVEVKDIGKSIFLILSSSDAVNWNITGDGAKDIKAIMMSGMRAGGTISGNIGADVPTFPYRLLNNAAFQLEETCACQGGMHFECSQGLLQTKDYIETVTGQKIDSFSGGKNDSDIVVPEIPLDIKQLNVLEKISKKNRVEEKKCIGPQKLSSKLTREQKAQVDKHPAVQLALQFINVVQENKFDEYSQMIVQNRYSKFGPDQMRERLVVLHNYYAGSVPELAYDEMDQKFIEGLDSPKKIKIPVYMKRGDRTGPSRYVIVYKKGSEWLCYGFGR